MFFSSLSEKTVKKSSSVISDEILENFVLFNRRNFLTDEILADKLTIDRYFKLTIPFSCSKQNT